MSNNYTSNTLHKLHRIWNHFPALYSEFDLHNRHIKHAINKIINKFIYEVVVVSRFPGKTLKVNKTAKIKNLSFGIDVKLRSHHSCIKLTHTT